MTLNENLKKYRKNAGLTQKSLAAKSGLSFSMVSKLESGEQTNPSFETLRKIAAVLRISPGELLNSSKTIEDQIDEYIEYKRGLNRYASESASALIDAETGPEEPCSDLNFKRKFLAINNSPAATRNFDGDYLECMKWQPEMKRLLSALKNATVDEIDQIARYAEAMKRC